MSKFKGVMVNPNFAMMSFIISLVSALSAIYDHKIVAVGVSCWWLGISTTLLVLVAHKSHEP